MPLGLFTAQLNFETLREIGQAGRNSQVFLAHDKQMDGEIAVKQIAKARMPHAAEYYRESKILYGSAHPNVVSVHYGCEDTDNIYIAMPFYKNGSLKSAMASRSLSVRECIRYAVQFLSGLNNIHSKGLIHFDVKPDNILLSDSNEALLSDFGLAMAMDLLGFASPDQVYGKQIPPEYFTGNPHTHHYDIYLAGLTLYRMLNSDQHFTRQLNFTVEQDYYDAILAGNFPNRNAYLHHIPKKLQRIVNRALSVDVADRYDTVLDFINDLNEIDENLDWFHSKVGYVEEWIRTEGDRRFAVRLDRRNSANITIECTKTIISSNRTTRLTRHCKTGLTNANVLSNIKKTLLDV
ncbi:serine/threonine-protein kinase [Flavobacterium selenitireducens]|uniref:serine/threonine-protein kinase n=1 Tax=Flavobacterium selenitireducens TaxID=2722704 RepID=UPI00168B5264|nr:serine/threonine-protein kinase [Flavobacterium selenitireducens]MBD3582743.1 serine/threonine protein kinase [Flavobacterium selenitireducens]